MVVPVLEYAACPVWQGARDTQKLESIQRKGLALSMGVPLTSGREAMEVELGVKPLEIRRLEILIREALPKQPELSERRMGNQSKQAGQNGEKTKHQKE